MMHDVKINTDGSITIDGDQIAIPNLEIQTTLPSGANSIVFHAKHLYLERPVVVKIWIKIKPNDKRNKFQQGMEEARKTAKVENANVIRIFDAGEVSGYFYATMEYFSGITLHQWIDHHSPVLGSRWEFARRLFKSVAAITTSDIFHGDLHPRNILVQVPIDAPPQMYKHMPPDFVIIDFGTSQFTSKNHSIKRHWDVFTQTLNAILSPIDINKIWIPAKPAYEDVRGNCIWYHVYIERVPYMLRWLGATWITHQIRLPGGRDLMEDVNKQELTRLIKQRVISIDKVSLGGYGDWHHNQVYNVGVEGEAMI